MKTCSRPGCLGTPNGGDLCPVHEANAGTPCVLCKGTGKLWYCGNPHGRALAMEPTTMACIDCGGTGLKDKSVRPPKQKPEPVDARSMIQLATDDK